jgi:hypothetical protein
VYVVRLWSVYGLRKSGMTAMLLVLYVFISLPSICIMLKESPTMHPTCDRDTRQATAPTIVIGSCYFILYLMAHGMVHNVSRIWPLLRGDKVSLERAKRQKIRAKIVRSLTGSHEMPSRFRRRCLELISRRVVVLFASVRAGLNGHVGGSSIPGYSLKVQILYQPFP